MAERDELAQHAAPARLVEVGADAERRQALVAVLGDLVGDLAAQHVDQVAGAEADAALVLEAVDAGQQLARRLGAVPGVGIRQAVVAIATRGAGLAEVSQQPHAPAIVRFGECQERIELAALDALEFLFRRALVDHAALVDHVLQAVDHPGVGGGPVAAGAAGLLVVGLDVLRQIEMGHEAHVGLVDAHAEGDRRHHHDRLLAQETVLVALAQSSVQTGVVRQRRDAFGVEPGRRLFDLLARAAIDDAGLAFVLVADEAQQLAFRFVLLDDAVTDVRPVETGHEGPGVFERQALDDVGPRDVVGGGRQCNARHAGEALVQDRQPEVLLAEVVAPLADAMRLVDREQAQQAAFVQRVEHAEKARRQQALRRGIEQHQAARTQLTLDALGLVAGQRGIEEGGMHAGLFERADLVVHQRDQRAHHHRHAVAAAVPHDRRHLVAQALAAAGGHQHQRVAAAGDVIDDRGLQATKRAVAEDFVQHLLGSGGGSGSDSLDHGRWRW